MARLIQQRETYVEACKRNAGKQKEVHHWAFTGIWVQKSAL